VSDDFFGELDKKISDLDAKQQARAAQRDADTAFSEKAIAEMHPVARVYIEKLRERGITARVSGNERGLTFEMRWVDNADHGLSVYPDLDTGRLKITRNSTDHTDGKRFRSTDGRLYGETDWKPSTFENALKSVINDYLSYAEKHGGIA
jgi:hypothetical protein